MKSTRITALLSLFLAGVTLFTACGSEQPSKSTTTSHNHTYADNWSVDADSHWYASTCGHNDARANFAPHSDKNNDGICDVCSYDYGHTHEFAKEWSHDEKTHWYAPTCTHDVKKEQGEHRDGDNNGICDTCLWNYDHEHSYKKEWSMNESEHWNDPACTHTLDPINKGAHEDKDGNSECDICSYGYGHTHTYKEEWSRDELNHWKDCTCSHGVKKDFSEHKDADNDGICDGCLWDFDHTHTYFEEWTQNDSEHWHAPSCKHNVEPLDKAAHEDKNSDGFCDICLYEEGHEHLFEEGLEYGEKTHWHAPLCGHAVKGDEQPHVDADKDYICDICSYGYGHKHVDADENGYCDECKYIASIKDAVNLGTSDGSAGKINGGVFTTEKVYDITTDYKNTVNKNYTFGNGYLFTSEKTSYSDIQYHYTLLPDGKVFAIEIQNGKPVKKTGTSDNMKGVSYYADIVGGAFTSSGAEDFLYKLYDFAVKNASGEIFETLDGKKGIYSFSFIYWVKNSLGEQGNLYEVKAQFNMTADNVIESIEVESFVYTAGAFDYTVDENSVATLNPSAKPDMIYRVSVSQTSGERTAENNYTPEKVIPADIQLTDESGKAFGSSYTVAPGERFKIYFANPTPSTALIALDTISVTSSDKNSLGVTYWKGDTYVSVNPKAGGTYTLTVKGTSFTKELTVTVADSNIEELSGGYFYLDTYGEYALANTAAVDVYAGKILYFTASPYPVAADGSYTASVSSGKLGSTDIDYLGKTKNVSTFTSSTPGSYVITMVSNVDSSVKCTLTVNVRPEPTVAQLLSGKRYTETFDTAAFGEFVQISALFTPEKEGAVNGTVVFKRNSLSETMSYSYADGEINLVHKSGDDLGYTLSFDNDFNLLIHWQTMGSKVSQVFGEFNTFNVLSGMWMTAGSTMTFGDSSFAYFPGISGETYYDFTYSVDKAGNIDIKFISNFEGSITNAKVDIEKMELSFTVSYKGITENVTMTKG